MTVPSEGEETTTTDAAKDALENLSLRPETASNNNAGWQTQGEKGEKGGKPKPPGKEESTHKWKEEDDRDFQTVTNRRASADHKRREYAEPRGSGGGMGGLRGGRISEDRGGGGERNSIPGLRPPRGYEKREGGNDFYNRNRKDGPSRPNQNRSGFSIGRGRGQGKGHGNVLGGPGGGYEVNMAQPYAPGFNEAELEIEEKKSCISEEFEKSIAEHATEFEKLFKDERESNPDRENIEHVYGAMELVKILRDLEAANACELPAEVDKDTVPLRSVKPGDMLWDLTMFANRVKTNPGAPAGQLKGPAWKDGEDALGRKKKDRYEVGDGKGSYSTQNRGGRRDEYDGVPEWALDGNQLKDRTEVGDSFLGGAMPALTEEEMRQMREEIASGTTRSEARVVPESEKIELTEADINGLITEDAFTQDIKAELMEQEAAKNQPRQQSRFVIEEDSPNVSSGGGFFGDLNASNVAQQHQMMQQQQRQQQPAAPVSIPTNWMYLDPAGAPQGPFTRDEITEWHQGGFFPMDLPLRPSDAPINFKYVPLQALLKMGWRYDQVLNAMNGGVRAIPAPVQQQQQQQQQQRQPTGGGGSGGGGLLSNIMGAAVPSGHPAAPSGPTKSLADIEGGVAAVKKGMPQPRAGVVAPKPNVAPSPSPATGGGLLGSIMGSAGGLPQGHHQQQQGQSKGMGMSLQEMEDRQRAMLVLEKQSEENARINRQKQEQEQKRLEMERQQKQQQQQQQQQQAQQKPAWGGAKPAAVVNEGRSLADIQREEAELERQRRANAPDMPAGGQGGLLGTPWGTGAPQNARAQPAKPASGSLAAVMAQEQAQARKRQEILQREANERMANMKGGWQGSGGSTVGGNDGQKSLAEIQREEEERRQREMAAKNEELLGMPQNAIGTAWATGKLASSSNPPPPQQQQPPPPKRPTMMMPRQMQGSQRKVQSDFDRPDSAGSAPRSNPGSHNNSIADNMNQIDGDSWGAPPAPKNKRALQQWCKRAMKTLNGSEDLTLVDFLLSLASAGEVQEYVGLYLGNAPKATEFGLELVKQKRADPSLKDGIARL